jgi:ubiquitin carboxyl-terminal hydrolase 16/45
MVRRIDRADTLITAYACIAAVVVHVGATALSGHYIAYVLVDPGVILDINKKRLVDDIATRGDGEASQQSGSASTSDDSSSTKKEDNRMWCYCSEYVVSHFVPGPSLLITVPDSTQIRLASVDEVMQAKAYLCFVS